MTSRERVQCILDREKPDRVAVHIGSSASGLNNCTFRRVKEYFGITSEDLVPRPDESASFYNDDVLEALGSDFRQIFLMPPSDFGSFHLGNGRIISEWGIEKRLVDGLIQGCSTPLGEMDINEMDDYPFPDPYAKGRADGVRQRAKHLFENTDFALASRAVSHGFFELSWELRGMENFLADMLIDEEYANKLLDKILDIQIGYYDVLLSEAGEYLQMVETADDYGTQKGPIMSPELFRKMIAPRRKKLNDFIMSQAPHVKIYHHTCGSVYHLMEDLIACGIDVLNPVQPNADFMDTYRLQEEFGDRVIFHGGIDEQAALIGTLEDLEAEMKRRIASLGKNYGYIMAPTSNFQDDMPLENIVNFASMAKRLGAYL